METKAISTPNAPKAIGPYSQAVKAGDFLFVSGQIPIDPATGLLEPADIELQTNRVFKNLEAILEEAGLDFSSVLKSTVLLTDIDDFSKVNEIYASYINNHPLPARAAFQVSALPKGALIEIELIAHF
ncbi:MAG: RidA family protein [Clostridiales bacterium]|jgi:2-iminobutanoate/2-iminopropanoate deaminase|nr:RidA family protein [Clostridiales bacterium]